MFNMQALVDALNDTAMHERSKYQMTLGGLMDALKDLPPAAIVAYVDGKSPGHAMSYRGYYSDVAFGDGEAITVDEFSRSVSGAIGATMEGYKGGDFQMSRDTPVWRSEYGMASGVAIMGVEMNAETAILTTKQID